MIDVTVKQQGGKVGDRQGRKSHTKNRRKHDAINLPKNLMDSDCEDCYESMSSEDENDHFTSEDLYLIGGGHKMRAESLSYSLFSLVISEKTRSMYDALRRLRAAVDKYKDQLARYQFNKGLKARSPFRNKLGEHQKKKQYFEIHRKEVQNKDFSPHLSGGKVIVRNLKPRSAWSDPTAETELPGDSVQTLPPQLPLSRSNVVKSQPLDYEGMLLDLVDALQDAEFMESFKNLSEVEVEHVFDMFVGDQSSSMGKKSTMPVPAPLAVQVQRTMSPLQVTQTPVTSPLVDQYDSSYETGSPTSTVVTSPGTSLGSESDQELELHPDPRTPNVVMVPTTPATTFTRCLTVPVMKPLGEVVPFSQTSATERLLEFQNSTSFCVQHFSIQLVRVIMSAKGQAASDKVEGFSKSLLSTMKIKLGNRAHEGDIWQLSILAHIEFLLARIVEYRSALLVRDQCNHTLLYIAAVEHFKKPLIARYVAESMYKVGFSPLEQVDENGNTVLHVLAELGDSHVLVLAELVMACGPSCVHSLNKALQTPLHLAAQSPHPHLTTLLTLLRMKANPFHQDGSGKSVLQYHVSQLVEQYPRSLEDLEVLRKMLQVPVSLSKDSLQALSLVAVDPSIPSDLKAIILEEVNKYGSKDLIRPKRIDKRVMPSSYN